MEHIYIHIGRGHYIGSCVVVRAETKKQAEEYIRERLDAMGLKHEALDIKRVSDNELIIYENSGDY